MQRAHIVVPEDLMPFLKRFNRKRQEHFVVATLDGGHQLVKVRLVTVGLANRTLIHPREVFFPAIQDNAVAIIIAHNHPSGVLDPSGDDDAITNRLRQAGDLLGIHLVDHLIIGPSGYLSYRETGRLK